MFITTFFSEDTSGLENNKNGIYGKYQCGGPCRWYITDKQYDDDKCIFSVPYNSQKYMYVFTPYDINTHINILKKFVYGNASLFENEYQSVLLTFEQIPNYDHDNECLLDLYGNILESDDLGGSLDYSYLD